MAIRVQRTLVCDFGERHAGTVHAYRVSVDGNTTSLDLCDRCAKPIHRLLERADKEPTEPGKMRVFSMEEIEARKQKKPPASE